MEKVLTCRLCGITSKTASFYKGVTSRCKECHKRRARENRALKADYYRAYDAQRYQDDPRVRERHLRYAKTEAGKEAKNRARLKWQSMHSAERAAHVILGNAVRDGIVIKPTSCPKCGAVGRLEGHHHDYAKPLDVEWLCRKCHVAEHR